MPKGTGAVGGHAHGGSARLKSNRRIAQSSSQEPLDKQTRDEPEVSNKPALKSLSEMVLAIQRQVNKLVDKLHVSEDDAKLIHLDSAFFVCFFFN
jgi:hypothetical protein